MRHNFQPIESLLNDLSQRCFATRWYNGIEWWGFHWMQTGPQSAGRGQITAHDVNELKLCHQELDGGWIVFACGMPAYLDRHRWMMAFGGGPDRVKQEAGRLERKLQRYLDIEDHASVDALCQGKMPWF